MNNLTQTLNICQQITPRKQRSLAFLDSLSRKYDSVAPSHKTIGKSAGVTRLTGKRYTEELLELGLIISIDSGKASWQTNIYKLHPAISTPAGRHILHTALEQSFYALNSCLSEYDTRLYNTTVHQPQE